MSLSKKFGLLIAFLVTVLLPVCALADDVSPEKQALIRQNCSSVQFTLGEVQKRDAVSRINRGRSYEDLQKQINALNDRFSVNKVSVPEITQAASDIQVHMDQFRGAYDRYYDDLSNAIKTDCKTKPVDFYQLVQRARDDRTNVGNEVSKVDDALSNYRAAVLAYQSSAPSGSAGASR